MCLSTGIHKTFNFPFAPSGKLMFLGVPVFKHIRISLSFFPSGYFFSVFCMVGIAKSFGILLQEFVAYFDIPVALGALAMGVCGGVYTIAGTVQG